MKFYEDFIGEDTSDTIMYYTGGDTEEQYLENVKSQPIDWYYKDKSISYNFNKHGHRSKNISDIDLNNYILFAGCSHTMGVGLELETTYPYIISKELGLDYYNIAIAASGPDVLQHNVLNWYYSIPQKPKLIMVQWPDHSRFLSYNTEYKNLMPKGNWRGDDETLRFIVDCEDSGLFYARKKFITELLSNVLQVPLIKFNYANQIGYDHDPLKMRKVDLARDLAHSGPLSHKKFSDSLIPIVSEKLGLHLP
jgi:hypothetical protein